MINVKNVTKKFADFTVLNNINFQIDDSSIYGLVGYNGAGKTTLLKICAGIYQADEGLVEIDGENVFDNPIARAKVFFLPDEISFGINNNLERLKNFYKGYYPDFSEKVFYKLTGIMGLDTRKNLSSFSKGMQKQAQIIIAMSTMPKYLILDEVFDGIDPQKKDICKKLFVEYMAETGCSIIMSSHNLQDVAGICDHVAMINGSRLTLNVSVDDISSAFEKYRMIFKETVSESDFDSINYKKLEIEGNLVTLIVSSDFDISSLEYLNPIHTDSVMLSLEEVLLNEMEDKKYDIKSIFAQ